MTTAEQILSSTDIGEVYDFYAAYCALPYLQVNEALLDKLCEKLTSMQLEIIKDTLAQYGWADSTHASILKHVKHHDSVYANIEVSYRATVFYSDITINQIKHKGPLSRVTSRVCFFVYPSKHFNENIERIVECLMTDAASLFTKIDNTLIFESN